MKIPLNLEYDLGMGTIAPYVGALTEGRARAVRRRSDGRVTFPPERVFGEPEGEARAFDWTDLSGRAEVLFRTDGPDGSFCLARFDGADNLAVARILNPEVFGRRARLQPIRGDLPGIRLSIVEGEQ